MIYVKEFVKIGFFFINFLHYHGKFKIFVISPKILNNVKAYELKKCLVQAAYYAAIAMYAKPCFFGNIILTGVGSPCGPS